MTTLSQTVDAPAQPQVAQLRPVVGWMALIARLVLGGVLLYAGYPKVRDVAGFIHAVNGYDLLPDWGVLLVASTLPWVECAVGASLILGGWTRGGALVATVLVAAFTGATSSAVIRHLDISCGCFSAEGSTVSWSDVALHGTLIVPAIFLLVVGAGRLGLDRLWSRSKASPA